MFVYLSLVACCTPLSEFPSVTSVFSVSSSFFHQYTIYCTCAVSRRRCWSGSELYTSVDCPQVYVTVWRNLTYIFSNVFLSCERQCELACQIELPRLYPNWFRDLIHGNEMLTISDSGRKDIYLRCGKKRCATLETLDTDEQVINVDTSN